MKKITQQQVYDFQKKIYDFYNTNKRCFDWRDLITPYRVVVSEIMLQQTQTSRVVFKFEQWMKKFSDFDSLAKASKQDVLKCWQGLGYNRRGLALHEFAQRTVSEFNGVVPKDPAILQTFRGIGPNTAGSICAFAFNMPVIFIETNIRTVFLYEFFKDQKNIHDKQLLPLIGQAVDKHNARDWYYALMDYGVFLKKELKASNVASKHYVVQSKFVGSKRQLRGAVVRVLSKVASLSYDELSELVALELPENKHCLHDVLSDLQKDGFLKYHQEIVTIK